MLLFVTKIICGYNILYIILYLLFCIYFLYFLHFIFFSGEESWQKEKSTKKIRESIFEKPDDEREMRKGNPPLDSLLKCTHQALTVVHVYTSTQTFTHKVTSKRRAVKRAFLGDQTVSKKCRTLWSLFSLRLGYIILFIMRQDQKLTMNYTDIPIL